MPSLLEAIEKKYCLDCQYDLCASSDVSGAEDSNSSTSSSGGVGNNNDQLIQLFVPRLPPLLSVPELLVLNDYDIDCAGDFETIKEKCRRVRELDLAQNKLRDWQEVFHIIRHMPRIEFLNLSKNQLSGPMASVQTLPVQNLKSIVLNGTYLDWLCIDVLLESLPNLEELHLSLNNYSKVLIDAQCHRDGEGNSSSSGEAAAVSGTVTPPPSPSNDDEPRKHIPAHQSLRTLHFTGNPVRSWHEICRLGRIFPRLETLVLAECPIGSLTKCLDCDMEQEEQEVTPKQLQNSDSPETCPYEHFQNLQLLNLSYAHISDWSDIDELARFPKLHNLRVKSWPLWDRLECTEHERRQLLIARLPNVTLLNGGGVIKADERESAERAFIRYYMDKPEWQRPARYNELIAKHGQLDPLVNVNLKPDKRVRVFLTYKETREERLVDIYRTVADLKQRLEKVVGLPANKMRLYYLDQDYREFGPEEMKYPNKLLYSYNIQTGDEIIIDEKNSANKV